MITNDLKARYIGALSVLADCGVQVDEDTRESIDMVLSHAQRCGDITYTQFIHRFDIEVVIKRPVSDGEIYEKASFNNDAERDEFCDKVWSDTKRPKGNGDV